ncbi:TMEM175 family protein [Sphingomonas sp. LB-2]|uniref:TMEM175 family protein n=1 Tax=Sphingomonas caeni TaxID=2984949 RepID=UPI0022312274|nr:TMEM175 family protein [Sphingomonas caeni]MCW3848638.1 TMEM175 family protein [Sphingomonas caeni]
MADDMSGHPPSGPGHALERLIFFSDAVFAIAITLLVIEIHVPELHDGHFSDLDFIAELAQLTPNFIGFFTSFFVIGAFWAGHHRAFDCARHWNPRLIWPNLMMLSAIAAMPFFTAFSSKYYGHRVPVALYCSWLLLTALLNIRVVALVTAPAIAGEEMTPARRWAIRQRGIGVALGAATAVVVSLFAPPFGQPAIMSIPFWMLLLRRIGPRG